MTAGPLKTATLLALAAALLYATASFSRDFWSPDEPDFAQAVREMGERGSYLLPYQNGVPYSEKPVLFYWAMAATTVLSGGDVHPGATRLVSVFACGFLVFGAALLAGWRGSREEALVAGAATAVAPLVFWQGQYLQIDALFSALLLALFGCQVMAEEDAGREARWVWGFHLLLPLAVLTKGPLAIVLTGLVAAARSVLTRSWRPITILRPVRGAAILVGLVVPWYLLAIRAGGPAYGYDLVVNQNWNRFFKAFDHIQPWWFYLESIWGDFSPWTLPALFAPFVLARAGVLRSRPELRFLVVACASVLVFLSTSGSKQGKYLLVVFPMAAVLLAAMVARLEATGGAGVRWLRRYLLFASALLLGGAIALWPVAQRKAPGFAQLAPLVAVPIGIGAVVTMGLLARRPGRAAPAMLALAATLAAGEAAAGMVVFRAVDVLKTGAPFYGRIAPLVSRGEPLAYFGDPYRCYPILKLRRKTEHLRSPEELAAWVARTPGAYVLADESEQRKWTDPRLTALVVVDGQPTGQDRILLLKAP